MKRRVPYPFRWRRWQLWPATNFIPSSYAGVVENDQYLAFVVEERNFRRVEL